MSELKASDIVIGSSDEISLSKLWGQGIRDIEGYFTNSEFGFTVLKLKKIVFVDGTKLSLAGEHDIAFLYTEDVEKHIGEGEVARLACEIDPDYLCDEDEDD